MKRNNKIILPILILFLLTSLLIGCIDPSQDNEKKDGDSNNNDNLILENTFYVDKSFNSETQGLNSYRFTTISKAINASSNNTTIRVSNGVYPETFVIDTIVTIIGEDAESTVIDGARKGLTIFKVNETGRLIISNVTIKNAKKKFGSTSDKVGIELHSNNNIIEHVIFETNDRGIYGIHAGFNIISSNYFVNNSEYGMYILSASDNNTISDNIFYDNMYGFRVKGCQFNMIYSNMFHENIYGLYLCCGATLNTVYENIFCENVNWDANDKYQNSWDFKGNGNFWSSFYLDDQGAFDNESDGIVDLPLVFSDNVDHYPLKTPPKITNPLMIKKNFPTYCLN